MPPAKVARVRDHNTILARLIKDDRLSPNRSLLATLIHKYFGIGHKNGKPVEMTEQEARDKELIYNILVTQFGNPKSIQWLDREDAGPTEPLTKENKSATDEIREAFDTALSR